MTKHFGYTVVQHSAFTAKGDTDFARGLESRCLRTKRELDTVLRAGGLVYATYTEAEDFVLTASYPRGYEGLIPDAQGSFSAATTVDGSAIYRPVRSVVG